MRSVLVLLIAALAGGALFSAASAADITWKVTVGFSGVTKAARWTPVFVDISNEGDSQTGEIVIPLLMRGVKDREVEYVTEVDLPRHAKKRYVVYLPKTDFDKIHLNLSGFRDEKDTPRFESAEESDLVVVAVGGDPGFLSFLNGMDGLGVSIPRDFSYDPYSGTPVSRSTGPVVARVGRLEWAGLPEAWFGWQGADVLVLGDTNLSGASPTAVEALREWIELGGTVIVPGGSLAPALASGPLASLLPGTVTGTTTLPDLTALGQWIHRPIEARPVLAATLSLLPEADVLCGSRAQPLIALRSVGLGRVIMTSFDYTATPVKYWDGQNIFWPTLLIYRAPDFNIARQGEQENRYMGGPFTSLSQAVSSMPQAELPSLWLIIGYLAVYIIILVPVNYTVLNRLDRRELAWVTTPAIVLLFTFGAYGLGYGMRGGSIIFKRIGIIETGAGSPIGHGTGYAGIFSPSRTTYELSIDAPVAASRELGMNEQYTRRGTRIYTTPTPRIADVNMNMWTTRAFSVDYRVDLKQGVSGYIEFDGVALTAHVRNNTPYTLANSHLIFQHEQGKGADIGPGMEREIRYAIGHGSRIQDSGSIMYGGPYTDRSLSEQTISSLYGDASLSSSELNLLPVLVARIPDAPVPISLAHTNPQTEEYHLLVVHLPIRVVRRTTGLVLPISMITSRCIASTGTIISQDDSGSDRTYEINHGSMTIEYALPLGGVPATAQRLALASPTGNLPTVDISAYDFTRHTWQVLFSNASMALSSSGGTGGMPSGGRRGMRRSGGGASGMPSTGSGGGGAPKNVVSFPHPRDFMSADGRVQINVSVPSGTAEFTHFYLKATLTTQ